MSKDGDKDENGNDTYRLDFVTEALAIPMRLMDVAKLGNLDLYVIDQNPESDGSGGAAAYTKVGEPRYSNADIYVDPANPATSAVKSGFVKAADGTVTKNGVPVNDYRKLVINGRYLRAAVGGGSAHHSGHQRPRLRQLASGRCRHGHHL